MMSSDASYAYAKACGIISKSYLGKRISILSGLHTLSELDRQIFPDLRRELPGRELLLDLERRITERAVRQILTIVSSYPQPPELLVRMLKVYEYDDLKVCLQHMAAGKKNLPSISDIGDFGTVRFEAFPDIKAMVHGTEYDFILPDLKSGQYESMDIAQVETKLDAHYYLGLTECLPRLSLEDRMAVQKILGDEISLRNCAWALRLRTYYQKSPGETSRHLMNIKFKGEKSPSLAADAAASLDFHLDSRQEWRGWKWEKLLNPEEPSVIWVADPRYFQNAASQYMYRLARKNLHRCPMAVSAVFCFIKLKQYEEDLLTSVAEGLALGIESAGVFKLLEVSAS
jgi:vacuolar-type H+-ATPase subunit C/Vma6